MTEASPPPSSQTGDDGEGQQQEQSGENGCGADRGTPAGRYTDIPATERMIYPRGSKLDRVYVATRKPDGLVPIHFMPIWPELPGGGKLPILPAPNDLFEISRGPVGTGLYRPVQDYTVIDPLNRERVVTTPYNSLHDPHAKALFDRYIMRNHILKHKLVFPDGSVRCNTKEFNDYRRYLNKRIYIADLNSGYAKMDKMEENQKEQVKRLKKDINRAEGAVFKAAQTTLRARQLYASKMNELRIRVEGKNAYNEFRSQAHTQMLAEARSNILLKGIAKEAQIRTKIALVKAADEKRRKYLTLQILANDKQATERLKAEKERISKEQEEHLIDWLSRRCEAQKRQIERASETKKTVAATLKKRAMKRQIKIDNDLACLRERLAARAAEEKRIWALVRKYFYRWLDNVRKRRARKPDAFHRSFWQLQGEMETTVTQLRKESGYEKFDDFIMNIVLLKRSIMAEIENEEKAEAAAALALEKQDDGADDQPKVGEQESHVTAAASITPALPPEESQEEEPVVDDGDTDSAS